MHTYEVNVSLPGRPTNIVKVQATSQTHAKQVAENIYGGKATWAAKRS